MNVKLLQYFIHDGSVLHLFVQLLIAFREVFLPAHFPSLIVEYFTIKSLKSGSWEPWEKKKNTAHVHIFCPVGAAV